MRFPLNRRLSLPASGQAPTRRYGDRRYDNLAETGSFNWTTSADGYNFENAIFFSDPKVVVRYEQEFLRIWDQAQ